MCVWLTPSSKRTGAWCTSRHTAAAIAGCVDSWLPFGRRQSG